MRTRKLLAAAALAALFGTAEAIAPPHDASFTTGTCDSCHKLHGSGGGTLMGPGYSTNNDACLGCHGTGASTGNTLGLPWGVIDQAAPGSKGLHHSWSGLADQPAYGASPPGNPEMANRLVSGTLQCATCHDPHADTRDWAPGSLHTSFAIGVDTDNTAGSGLGRLRLASVGAGARSAGYRVQITGAGQLSISHDFGSGTPTWYGPIGFTLGNAVALDDPAVTIVLTGTPQVGDAWDFYAAYPHLRQTNVADAMCLQCHASRAMSHAVVGAESTDGVTYLSHPAGDGETLGSNGKGYDLAPATMLDATGVTQVAGDGNRTNDLVLDGGTTVRCTTCHAPHNADSNSLTVDPR